MQHFSEHACFFFFITKLLNALLLSLRFKRCDEVEERKAMRLCGKLYKGNPALVSVSLVESGLKAFEHHIMHTVC